MTTRTTVLLERASSYSRTLFLTRRLERSGLPRLFRVLFQILALVSPTALGVMDVNKSFNPININPGQDSVLTVFLRNSDTRPITQVTFDDNLPPGVTATSVVPGNTCGAAVDISDPSTIAVTSGTVPAGDGFISGTCSISITVTSTTAGTYVNTIPGPPSPGVTGLDGDGNPISNAAAASATLTVSTNGITGTKSFSPATIHIGGVSTVTFTLNNPNPTALTNLSFTDSLPAPLQYDSATPTGGTCGVTFSGPPIAGDTAVSVTGGAIPANGSCTITFNVRVDPTTGTSYQNSAVTNSIGANTISTAQGASNPGTISGTVTIQKGVQVAKAFSPATVVLNTQSSTLTIELRNYNITAITTTADQLVISDAMPTGVAITPGTAATTCAGGIAAISPANTVTLTGGPSGLTIPAAPDPNTSGYGFCTVTVTVTGTQTGSRQNTIGPATIPSSPSDYPWAATSGTLVVTVAPGQVGVSKSFSPTTIVPGSNANPAVTTLTITLTNASGADTAITSFADNLTTMGAGFTIASSPAASTTCPGSPVLTATPGTTLISMSGGTLPAAGCTITVPVAVGPSAVPGTRTNNVAVGAFVTAAGNNTLAATANVSITRPASITKTFTPATVPSNGISRMTITVTHANGALPFTNMGLTDDLSTMNGSPVALHTVANPQGSGLTNTCGGTVTAVPGSQLITYSGGALAAGATSCQFQVDVQAPAGTGTRTNTIAAGALTTAEGYTENRVRTATLTRTSISVALNKEFNPVNINGGGPSRVTITILNNLSGAVNLTNVGLTDQMPPGVQIYWDPNPTFTGTNCTGGTITAVPGTDVLTLSGASISANRVCSLAVNVTSLVEGNKINNIPAQSLTSAQGVTNSNSPDATLGVQSNVNIAKSFSPEQLEVGAISTLTLRILNATLVSQTLAAPGVTDTLPVSPSAVTVAGSVTTDCAGAVIGAALGSGTITVSNATIPASSSCSVVVPVRAAGPGTHVNTIPVNSVRTLIPGVSNFDAATDTLVVYAQPTITKAFASPGVIVPGGTNQISFTLTNPNDSTILAGGFTGGTFTDTLPANVTVANQTFSETCTGTPVFTAPTGGGTITVAGITLGPLASCIVRVNVTSTVPGTYPNTASGVLTNQTTIPGPQSNTVNLVVLAQPVITKSFSPDPIPVNGTSTLTLTLSNPNSLAMTLGSTTVFSDVFPVSPGQMRVASPFTFTNSCGGTLQDSGGSALAASDVGIRLNGNSTGGAGSIPASGTCTITINVTAPTAGSYVNTSSTMTGTVSGVSRTSATGASDTLAVTNLRADLRVTKQFSPPGPWVPGMNVTYTIGIENLGPDPAVDAPLADDVPARINVTSWACSPESACSPSSGTGNTVRTAVSLASGASATLTVSATVPTGPETTIDNLVTIGQGTNAVDPNMANNEAWAGPIITVPVTLSSVASEYPSSAGKSGRTLRVTWTTETEAGNLGFHVWGVRGKETLRLTSRMVPGSLGTFDSKTYSVDVADPGVESIYIEEIDVQGGTRRHGPFKAGGAFGAKPEKHAIDWALIRREQARLMAERDGALAPVPGRARLLVERAGIVRVTAEALKAAGVSFDGQPAASIALLEKGQPVPITVQCNGKSSFGAGCYVEFLGSGIESLYTKSNVYTLLVDRKAAQRIPVDASPAPAGPAVTSYRETRWVEKELKYCDCSPNGDPWYEADILAFASPASRNFTVDVDALVPSGRDPNLRLDLWGITDWPASPDHHVIVKVNGVTVGERTFNGMQDVKLDVPVPAHVLNSGINTITVLLPGDTGVAYDMVAVDRYGLSYDRDFVARSGALTFEAAGNRVEIKGLAGEVTAYRTGRNTGLVKLAPQVVGSGASQVVALPSTGAAGTFTVADASGLVTPMISRDPAATLDLSGRADLLIVTHPSFLPQAEQYATFKNASGVRAKVVDVVTAYDVYGWGIVGSEPIQTLIRQARQNMGISSVLLVGGDTSDPFNYTGTGSVSLVPTPYGRTGAYVAFAPLDPLYGDTNGDRIPEISVGRWPVRTVSELDAVITKSMTFTGRTETPTVLLAADRDEPGFSYREASDVFGGLLPGSWVKTRAYVDVSGVAGARQTILQSLNAGPYLANWFGHSSDGIWSFDRLLTTSDALALKNSRKPAIVTQWGCWNTYHVLPAYNTLGHGLLLSDDRGAAAVIGAATLTNTESDRQFAQIFLPRLVQPGMTLGQAMVDAKRQFAGIRPHAVDVILGVTLLGDPTLTLPQGR